MIAIDGLLSADDHAGLLAIAQHLECSGHADRLDLLVAQHQDAAVGAHRQRGADGFLALLYADRNHDNLARRAGFSEAQCFFDGNFVEGVHGHFDVGGLDARIVRLDANFDVVVNDSLNRYQHFHWLVVPAWCAAKNHARMYALGRTRANPPAADGRARAVPWRLASGPSGTCAVAVPPRDKRRSQIDSATIPARVSRSIPMNASGGLNGSRSHGI